MAFENQLLKIEVVFPSIVRLTFFLRLFISQENSLGPILYSNRKDHKILIGSYSSPAQNPSIASHFS